MFNFLKNLLKKLGITFNSTVVSNSDNVQDALNKLQSEFENIDLSSIRGQSSRDKELIELGKLSVNFASEPPKGLDPTFYYTLSYEGDMEQYKQYLILKERYSNES